MSVEKRIITHSMKDGRRKIHFSNGFLFSSSYDKTLPAYQAMAAIAKADFPHLRDRDIECGVVMKSTYMQGVPYVRFHLPAKTKKRGYWQHTDRDFTGST